MNGDGLKRRFLSFKGFLGQFFVEKLGVKNWLKVRLTPYKKMPKMAVLGKIIFD